MSYSEKQLAEAERLCRVAVDEASALPEYETAKVCLAALAMSLALEVRKLQAEVARMKSEAAVAAERAENVADKLELASLGMDGYIADVASGAAAVLGGEVVVPLRALL